MSGRKLMVGTVSGGALLVLAVLAFYLTATTESSDERPAWLSPEEPPAAALVRPTGESPAADEAEAVEETPAPPPRPPVPPELAGIFDESDGTIARIKAVDALPDEQTPEALSALRWLLRNPDASEVLRNSAARKLLECGEESLASDLTEMLWDEKETPKWRNYCVQFLKDCYDSDGSAAVLATIFEAAEADEEQVRSCGIWSLVRVATPRDRSKAPDEDTLRRIRAAALAALQEKDAPFLIRLAGVQSCARLGLEEALPEIRELAGKDATQPTHLRVVSIAALGDLGDRTDLPLLDRLAESAEVQLGSAAALAAKKVRSRAAEARTGAGGGDAAPAHGPKDADVPRDF